jgi:hypothetical protein
VYTLGSCTSRRRGWLSPIASFCVVASLLTCQLRAALLEQQNGAVQARVRERAEKDKRMTVFTFLHK